MVGKTLGNYRIIRKLGQGGMGEVFLAEDRVLGRKVAVKFVSDAVRGDATSRERFLREARAAASLSHRHIAVFHEFGEAQGHVFHVSEYVDGETLRERLQKGALPVGEAIEWGIQLTDAVAAAHARGILHRDIKPGNVMVNRRGEVKLLDFGLAKELIAPGHAGSEALTAPPSLTETGMVVGTIGHAAPEVQCGKRADARSDVFSLGVVLYAMVAGRAPFAGTSRIAVMKAVMLEDPAPLGSPLAPVPDGLERIIRKALAKEPQERYPSARELLVELQDVKRGLATKSVPARRPRYRKLAAALFVVGLTATALLALSLRPKPASRSPRHRQITYGDNAWMPEISRDGRRLAYVTGESDDRVMVRDLAGGEAEEWFREGAVFNLRWSPDGSRLLVSAGDEGLTISLVSGPAGTGRKFPGGVDLAWSPDGARFATCRPGPKGGIRIYEAATERKTVFARPTAAATAYGLDWSLAGDRLALASTDGTGRGSLWAMSTDGLSQTRLLDHASTVTSPRWSTREDAIYYWRQEREALTGELWKTAVHPRSGAYQGPPAPVLRGLALGSLFSISGDGRTLLYTRILEFSNLWMVAMDAEGRVDVAATRGLTTGTSWKAGGAVSPDGLRLALVTREGERCSLATPLIEGGPAEVLLSFEGSICSPAWSPDGKYLAFRAVKEGIARLWMMSAQGGPPREFARTQVGSWCEGAVVWLPDGRLLYQSTGNRNYRVLDPVTEEETALVSDESMGWMFFALSSPDGKQVAVFWNRKPDAGVWVISLRDAAPRLLYAGPYLPFAWSRDGKWIYVAGETPAIRKVLILPAAGGEPRATVTLPFEDPISSIRASPDGGRFICQLMRVQTDIWLAEDFDPDL